MALAIRTSHVKYIVSNVCFVFISDQINHIMIYIILSTRTSDVRIAEAKFYMKYIKIN